MPGSRRGAPALAAARACDPPRPCALLCAASMAVEATARVSRFDRGESDAWGQSQQAAPRSTICVLWRDGRRDCGDDLISGMPRFCTAKNRELREVRKAHHRHVFAALCSVVRLRPRVRSPARRTRLPTAQHGPTLSQDDLEVLDATKLQQTIAGGSTMSKISDHILCENAIDSAFRGS